MNRANHQDIRIGTIVPARKAGQYIRRILSYGFESFQLTFGGEIGDLDVEELAGDCLDACCGQAIISCVGIYGNPLVNEQTEKDWERLIRSAKHFECSVVSGFTGAIETLSVQENIPRFAEVFGRLAKIAEDNGVKIAFENCDMGGTWQSPRWNIAHAPRAWEMMFDAVKSDVLGLEWEPCHQMVSFIDPIAQLRKWVKRVVHIHGKDATVAWDVIKTQGIRSGIPYIWHRTPGFGDSNWTDIITILRQGEYIGAIDIEGWHDPIYRDELEMTGQVRALNYLKACRGGDYVPNPE